MILAIIIVTFILLGIIFSGFSGKLLINYFTKVNKIESHSDVTSFELLAFFITNFNLDVKVAEYSTFLDNSYDIKRKIIFLSSDIFNNKSIGALAVSMHELGHAIQHNKKSKLFNLYYFFTILNKVTSLLIFPLLVFLVVSLFLPLLYLFIALLLLLIFYIINLISRVIIIPLENNASKIAISLLKEYNILDKSELKMAEKLLKYAVFTYVGGFFNYYVKIFKKIIRRF